MEVKSIYDAARDGPGEWELVSDRVMGGVSDGALSLERVAGRPALRLRGRVRLENDGGFLQMARNVAPAEGWDGVLAVIRGRGDGYNLHLRTADLDRPWQSFRADLDATETWQSRRIAFADLVPHRTEAGFDPARLRRLGLVAIGRAFAADLALVRLSLWRA